MSFRCGEVPEDQNWDECVPYLSSRRHIFRAAATEPTVGVQPQRAPAMQTHKCALVQLNLQGQDPQESQNCHTIHKIIQSPPPEEKRMLTRQSKMTPYESFRLYMQREKVLQILRTEGQAGISHELENSIDQFIIVTELRKQIQSAKAAKQQAVRHFPKQCEPVKQKEVECPQKAKPCTAQTAPLSICNLGFSQNYSIHLGQEINVPVRQKKLKGKQSTPKARPVVSSISEPRQTNLTHWMNLSKITRCLSECSQEKNQIRPVGMERLKQQVRRNKVEGARRTYFQQGLLVSKIGLPRRPSTTKPSFSISLAHHSRETAKAPVVESNDRAIDRWMSTGEQEDYDISY